MAEREEGAFAFKRDNLIIFSGNRSSQRVGQVAKE
jgi:hypothetical protein